MKEEIMCVCFLHGLHALHGQTSFRHCRVRIAHQIPTNQPTGAQCAPYVSRLTVTCLS